MMPPPPWWVRPLGWLALAMHGAIVIGLVLLALGVLR
jgi:hypothetical protein